jgi:MYXO-CTERM domain-containing protein
MTVRRDAGTAGLQFLLLLALTACGNDGPKERAVDCSAVPDAPLEINQLEDGDRESWPTGHHDVAFDPEGWIVGHNMKALLRANRDGRRELLTSAIGGAEGMEYLPDGRLVVATNDGQGIVAVHPDGAIAPLAPDLRDAFSVVLGPDKMIYSADNDRVYRIDPDTGNVETYLDSVPDARVLNWSLDHRLLYVGTRGQAVYVIDLDRHLNPAGAPRLFATLPGDQPYQDGLAVDVCGNLYLPMWPDNLYRLTPDGTFSLYHHWPSMDFYGHGLKWGSGIGGWRQDALYMPQPWNDSTEEGSLYTVVEVVVGVPGRPPGGFPRPAPPPDPHALTCASTAAQRPARPPLALLTLLVLLALRRRPRQLS